MEAMDGDGGGVGSRSGSGSASASEGDDRVREWEDGLPSVTDLTPLYQCLISPQLASAFSITSDIPPFRSSADVNRASHSMFSILRSTQSLPSLPSMNPSHPSSHRPHIHTHPQTNTLTHPHAHTHTHLHTNTTLAELASTPGSYPPHTHHSISDENEGRPPPPDDEVDTIAPGSDSSEGPTQHDGDADADADAEPEPELEEVESAPAALENSVDDPSARTLKRPRLVWTPELHKRFIEAVAYLGIKSAVPKTIMQLMNVEGLTRENVASHLQKYRLYLKRMQGLSTEGPSSSDHLFASTPVPPSLAASTRFYTGVPAHLEDIVQVPFTNSHVPMPMGRGHVDGSTNAAGVYAPSDPFSYNNFVRHPSPTFVQGYPKESHGMRENQTASSSHHILRLFPTGK